MVIRHQWRSKVFDDSGWEEDRVKEPKVTVRRGEEKEKGSLSS